MQRHTGYVVGSTARSGSNPVWKVRVKDVNSPYNGEIFVVASVHDEMMLARGLNVHFALGTVDDTVSQKVFRAVDVRLDV